MLHQVEPLDADTENAVEDVLETVAELGSVAARAIDSTKGGPGRAADVAYARELYERVASRARSAAIAPADLLNLASDRIAANHRRSQVRDVQIADLLGLKAAA